ncbi:hypothetical protein ACHQM5_013395 [Ranunculus cassubicifolius]
MVLPIAFTLPYSVYEAFVFYNNQREKLYSGDLEHLVLHLPQLKDLQHDESDYHFKLQLPENLRRSTWFNKYTLSRFLHIICFPKLFAIGDEISQLEEARKFHLSLYGQSKQHKGTNHVFDSFFHLFPSDCDAAKIYILDNAFGDYSFHNSNELLRALNLRLGALSKELIAAFGQATNGTFSYKQILDLIAFCQHFGAVNLRNLLSRYLELSQMNQDVDSQTRGVNSSHDSGNDNGKVKVGTAQPLSPVVNPVIYGASPAKAAQVERHSSSESEYSNSGAEDQPYIDRSRSMVRSASPRRSASPMRRVQIGKSGSRRAPALTIKSLSYIPAKERIFSTRDTGGNSSDEESAQPLKKPESNATSMSVRDAISLFEKKQKDESTNLQKKKFPSDTVVSTVNPSKSVLRRWSSGMGDPPTHSQSANASETFSDTSSKNLHDGVNQDTHFPDSHLNQGAETASLAKTTDEDASPTAGQVDTFNSAENQTDNGSTEAVESNNKVAASADWNRQKEDELNLMMMKMMETKPARNRTMGSGVTRSQELPSGQRGGFYDHYKQKREEKLRGENSGKQAEKDEKLKNLQGMLDQRKVEMSSKSAGVAGKQDSLGKPRKTQKTPSPSSTLQPKKEPSKSSSPLRQPKKESPKPAAPKKISSKASPLPASRKSWPSAPSPKSSDVTPNRTPSWVSSTGIAAPRRKSQPTPSPIRSSPKVERTPTQPKPKNTKVSHIETNPTSKSQEVKKQRPVKKSVNKTEAKALQTSQDSSSAVPAKPSFYNKVTRKGSVVPLESKPFLRKRTGAGPGVAPVKSKVSQSEEPLNNENVIHAEEVFDEMPKPMSPQKEENQISPILELPDVPQEAPVADDNNVVLAENEEILKNTSEPLEEEEILPEIESAISPTAWVEIEEHKEDLPIHIPPPTNTEPVQITSPRVRHSLSQMLQEDSGEPEIIEWGNAENPPAIVYQKDVSKGLKRLLKFARKSKGDANATGWSSPSVFSDGEDDPEETKASSKRHADAILRKASMQAKGFGQLRTSLGASYDGGNPSRSSDFPSLRELHSGQSNMSKFGTQASDASGASSTKSSRSFFSLSTFRSSKSNETKLR